MAVIVAVLVSMIVGVNWLYYRALSAAWQAKDIYKDAAEKQEKRADKLQQQAWDALDKMHHYKTLYEELLIDDQDETYVQKSLGLAEKPDL